MVYSHFLEASDQEAAKVMGGLVKRGGAPQKPHRRSPSKKK
jgi:hypothetical protein